MPASERRYSIQYPELDHAKVSIRREANYFNWKNVVNRFGGALRREFKFPAEIVDKLVNNAFLSSDKALLQDMVTLLGVPRFSRALDLFFRPVHNTNLLFPPRNEGRELWVNIINSIEHYLQTIPSDRFDAATSEDPVTVERLLTESKEMGVQNTANCLDLAMSFIDHPELFRLIQADYAKYPAPGNNRLVIWSKIFPSIGHVDAYLSHPQRVTVHSVLPLNDIIDVFTGTYDSGYVSPLLWLEYPKLLKLMIKIRESFPSGSVIEAGNKRLLFQLIMSTMGRHGVTDEEVLAQVFAQWIPQLEKYKAEHPSPVPASLRSTEDLFYQRLMTIDPDMPLADRKFEALEQLPVGQQREWLSQIKSGDPVAHPPEKFGLVAPGLRSVRENIRRRKGIPENLAAKEMIPDAERANWLESSYHPLFPYLSLGGFEVEANFPAEMNDRSLAPSLYKVVGEYGYRNGRDTPIELAPDPLLRPEHVCGQFRDYVDAGLLDVHAETTQSAHLNIEVFTRETMAVLFRLAYLTGRACHPLYEEEIGEDKHPYMAAGTHELRIYEKKSEAQHSAPLGRTHYVEAKGLRITTPNDFTATTRMMLLLGSAGKAYEQCWLKLNHMKIDEYRQRQSRPESAYAMRFSIEKLQFITDKTQRQLAGIWYRFIHEAQSLTDRTGYLDNTFWTVNARLRNMKVLGREVREVFPTPFDHDDLERVQRSSSSHLPIQYDNKVFPNIVAAARHLSEKYVQQVRRAQTRELEAFRKQLARVNRSPVGPSLDEARDNFLIERYGYNIIEELSSQKRAELLQRMNYYLFEDPFLEEGDYNVPP